MQFLAKIDLAVHPNPCDMEAGNIELFVQIQTLNVIPSKNIFLKFTPTPTPMGWGSIHDFFPNLAISWNSYQNVLGLFPYPCGEGSWKHGLLCRSELLMSFLAKTFLGNWMPPLPHPNPRDGVPWVLCAIWIFHVISGKWKSFSYIYPTFIRVQGLQRWIFCTVLDILCNS